MVICQHFAMAKAWRANSSGDSAQEKGPGAGAMRRGLYTARWGAWEPHELSEAWPQWETVGCQLRLIGSGGMSLLLIAS